MAEGTQMTKGTTRALGGAAVVAGVVGGGVGAAGAGPKGGETHLTSDGTSYEVVAAESQLDAGPRQRQQHDLRSGL
jgi:hypothetical protein